MEDTHARVEEDRALDSSRLRSSARLGFGAVSTVNTVVAVATTRIARRKRKKRRRQRRSSNDDVHLQGTDGGVEVATATTTTGTGTTATTTTTTRSDASNTNNLSEEKSGINDGDNNKSRSPRDENVEQQRVRGSVSGGGSTRLASTSVVQDNNTLHGRRVGKQAAKRCGNTNAGRRSAMTMDLQRLINEVHSRPAIWDQKNVSYHNRDVIFKLWREIAKACDVSTDVAKSKWKHLRDNFRNELKKTYRGKCEGNVSEHDSKWVWFRSLFFLRDQMNSRVIGCALSQNCANNMRSSPEGTQIEPQIDILEGHEETQFEDLDGDSCQSLISNDDGLHRAMPPPKMNKVGRKRVLIDAMENDGYVDVDRKRYESVQKRLAVVTEEEDDTYHFLMSVKNPLRSLPVDRQMFVRLKIQELVYNEINSQNQQGRVYDSSQTSQDVKPPRNGNGTSVNANASTGGEPTSDVSNPASLLQNCTTEGSNDEAFFG